MKKIYSSALSISFYGILLNLFLTVLKIVVGILGNSQALVSDGIHSSSDLLSSLFVTVGIKLSIKPTVVPIVVSLILVFTALVLGYNAICDIMLGNQEEKLPTTLAVITSAIPFVSKEAFSRFEKVMAKKFSSKALEADAIHHSADALVSLGVFVGVIFGHFGYPFMESVVSFVISLLILSIALKMFDKNFIKTYNF